VHGGRRRWGLEAHTPEAADSCVFWRSTALLVTTLVIVLGVLVALGAVLLVVYRLRPDVFKVNVGVTRLVNLKIEMRWPRPPDGGATG
jgi:hypothetical protein